jgi:hypothetical protein
MLPDGCDAEHAQLVAASSSTDTAPAALMQIYKLIQELLRNVGFSPENPLNSR